MMDDFMVDGISEEVVTHFSLFLYYDLVIFEDVKKSKWRKPMDEEIAAIEHNNPW